VTSAAFAAAATSSGRGQIGMHMAVGGSKEDTEDVGVVEMAASGESCLNEHFLPFLQKPFAKCTHKTVLLGDFASDDDMA